MPKGQGLWPAIWMLPQDDKYGGWAASGEIDVMEIVGTRPAEYLASVHFGSHAPKRSLVTHVHKFPAGQTVADFHVYAVEWEPGEIRWSVDGVTWATQTFWWSCSRLRGGKGVAGSGDFRLAGFAAPQANKPPIDAQHDPASIPLAHTAPHHKKTIISIV